MSFRDDCYDHLMTAFVAGWQTDVAQAVEEGIAICMSSQGDENCESDDRQQKTTSTSSAASSSSLSSQKKHPRVQRALRSMALTWKRRRLSLVFAACPKPIEAHRADFIQSLYQSILDEAEKRLLSFPPREEFDVADVGVTCALSLLLILFKVQSSSGNDDADSPSPGPPIPLRIHAKRGETFLLEPQAVTTAFAWHECFRVVVAAMPLLFTHTPLPRNAMWPYVLKQSTSCMVHHHAGESASFSGMALLPRLPVSALSAAAQSSKYVQLDALARATADVDNIMQQTAAYATDRAQEFLGKSNDLLDDENEGGQGTG